MKLKGRVASVNIITEMFIREGQEPLVFKAAAIMDGEDFSKYVPEVVPPMIKRVGEDVATPNYTDEKYIKAVNKRANLQTYWMIIKSLQATEDLVWDKVKLDDPTTWMLLDDEIKEFGLSNIEKTKLINAVMRANSLDERFIEAAKARFIRSQQAAKETATSSQADELPNTKLGAPVSI